MTPPAPSQRYPEIDLLRTLAIILMIVYHLAYDLHQLRGIGVSPFSPGMIVLARFTAGLFIGLTGLSFILSREKMRRRHTSTKTMVKRWLYRAAILGIAALAVTAATYIFDRETFVRYGVLHMIATSVFLLPLFANAGMWNFLIGLGMIVAGFFVTGTHADTSLLLPLGVTPPGFASIDYFPLLPWFGVSLLGAAVGDLLYIRDSELKRRWDAYRLRIDARYKESRALQWLAIPGKHSLAVYLVHQPILIGILQFML